MLYRLDSWEFTNLGTVFPMSGGVWVQLWECVVDGLNALQKIAQAAGDYWSCSLPEQLPIIGWPEVQVAQVVTIEAPAGVPGVPGVQLPPLPGAAPAQPRGQPSPPPVTAAPLPPRATVEQNPWAPPAPAPPPLPRAAPEPPRDAADWVPGAPASSSGSRGFPPEAPAASQPASSWQRDWKWRAEERAEAEAATELQSGLSANRAVVTRRVAEGVMEESLFKKNLEILRLWQPHQGGGWQDLLNVVGVLPSALMTSVICSQQLRLKNFDQDFPFSYGLLKWPPGATAALAPGLSLGVPGVRPPVEVAGWTNHLGEVIGPAPTLYNAGEAPPDGNIFFMQGLRQYFWVFPVLNDEVLPPRKLPGEPLRDTDVPGVPKFEPPVKFQPSWQGARVEKVREDTYKGETWLSWHRPFQLLYVDLPSLGMVVLGLALVNDRNNYIHLWHCGLVTRVLVERANLAHKDWILDGIKTRRG